MASQARSLVLGCYNPRARLGIASSPRFLAVSCKTRHKSLSSQGRRQHAKKVPPKLPSLDRNLRRHGDRGHEVSDQATLFNTDADTGVISETEGVLSVVEEISGEIEKPESSLEPPNFQLEDLMGMIRNAEKNILLLNKARVCAMVDVDKILAEKESLREEMNSFEMRLAETDERLKLVSQEKVNAEFFKEQLERLKKEISSRNATEGDNKANTSDSPLFLVLNALREENSLLKTEVQLLKTKLTEVKETEGRITMLENERSALEASLGELQSRFAVAQNDVARLAPLENECKDLWEKVENLQSLLDSASKQEEQAALVLLRSQDLQIKVDKLEASLEAAKTSMVSSEKSQYFEELLQQKIKSLEERLWLSDEEIYSQMKFYQESVKEFQATLDKLQEETERSSVEQPADDMPWEFWSHLMLMIDGWFLEKKMTSNDSKILKELAWKRDIRLRDLYLSCKGLNENETIEKFVKLTLSRTSPGLHIIHIAAEMAPIAKVGGLGDVVSGLAKALHRKGHLVEIVLPKYDCMQYDLIKDLKVLDAVIQSYFEGHMFRSKIYVGIVEGLPVYFIEPDHPAKFFWRAQYYGEHDDFKRFSFFSRAVLELLHQAGKKPDIIHCHDWQTAFVAPLYWDIYANRCINSARICFTCHNFEYQGKAPASQLATCGLDVHHLNRPDRMQDNTEQDKINLVKGAIVYSNIVTTVSPTYAEEVQSQEGGQGLHETLKSHSRKFYGILNGIDTETWNPSTDRYLRIQYNADDLQGKTANKDAIRKHLELSSEDGYQPLVGCITRLVPQKGVHLIRHAVYKTLELGGQFVLLGSSPVPHIQREFEGIASQFENHPDVRLVLKYDDALSHWIYAASDMFVIPSIFEPCGLTQMIAMRYGSVPIVRKTGGLNDSVFDFDDNTTQVQFRNGFTFVTPDEQGLSSAMERAFNYYLRDPSTWKQLIQKVMRLDFSWNSPATQYEELYEKAVARARAASRS